MFQLGVGFNPGFINKKTSDLFLPFPPGVSLMEFGVSETLLFKEALNTLKNQYELEYSLHIARSPITENNDAQDLYIDFIKNIYDVLPFINIGFHLTGERHDNIGKFGFSSAFNPNEKTAKQQASRFLAKIKENLNVANVFIENVNYYCPDKMHIFGLWESISELCSREGAILIFDLAHHIVNCENLGVPTDITLGLIPWKHVKEIHLSGIIQAKDGSFHDGHSRAVSSFQWDLLNKILNFYIKDIKDVCITIEHTDIQWSSHTKEFLDDFEKLLNIKENFAHSVKTKENIYFVNQDKYSRTRLKNVMYSLLPYVARQCQKHHINYEDAFNQWFDSINLQGKERIVLSKHEDINDLTKNCCALFSQFFKEKYAKETTIQSILT